MSRPISPFREETSFTWLRQFAIDVGFEATAPMACGSKAGRAATPRLSTVLGVEFASPRPTRNSRRPSEADRGHGSKNCDLGEGAHRRGAPAQVGHPSFTPDDLTLHASSSPRTTTRDLVAPLDDVCSQPRADHAGLRLPGREDRQLPSAVRLRDRGSGTYSQDRH